MEYKVGDRVVVYSTERAVPKKYKGTISELDPMGIGYCKIELDEGTWMYSYPQSMRRLKPKQKKVAREWWINFYDGNLSDGFVHTSKDSADSALEKSRLEYPKSKDRFITKHVREVLP